ncbi:MAG: DUF1566 domain-containing protein [Nitrospiraceae bacterium]
MQKRKHSGFLIGLLSVGVLIATALTASPTQAASGNGPYYAEPAWDQTLPAVARFMILNNFASAAVLDRETGLVWEKSPATTTGDWEDATDECINKNVGGRRGWRLPAIAELTSLIDPSVAPPGPTLPVGHPFSNVQSAFYGSATTRADHPGIARSVNFSNGGVASNDKNDIDFHAWCVRGGMNADAY